MSQLGSGCMLAAATIAAVMMASLTVTFHCGVAEADNYTIQWHEKPDLSLLRAKNFNLSVGDIVTFTYDDALSYNVIKVDEGSYNVCSSGSWPVGHSGNDQFTLTKGSQYFICGAWKHCQNNGMKVAIQAN